MGLEQRRIIIGFENDGTPITKMLKARNQEEMNERIVQAFVESGRIREFLSPINQFTSASENVRLEDYANNWLNRKRKVKATTKTTYRKRLDSYIIPELGNKLIGSITSSDVQKLLDKHKNLSEKTLKETKGVQGYLKKLIRKDMKGETKMISRAFYTGSMVSDTVLENMIGDIMETADQNEFDRLTSEYRRFMIDKMESLDDRLWWEPETGTVYCQDDGSGKALPDNFESWWEETTSEWISGK